MIATTIRIPPTVVASPLIIDPSILSSSSASTPQPSISIPPRNRIRPGPGNSKAFANKRQKTDMGEQLDQVQKVINRLASAQENPLVTAVHLLQDKYESLLTEENMEMALDMPEDESKAVFFTALNEGNTRDRWLERKAGVEVLSWDRSKG